MAAAKRETNTNHLGSSFDTFPGVFQLVPRHGLLGVFLEACSNVQRGSILFVGKEGCLAFNLRRLSNGHCARAHVSEFHSMLRQTCSEKQSQTMGSVCNPFFATFFFCNHFLQPFFCNPFSSCAARERGSSNICRNFHSSPLEFLPVGPFVVMAPKSLG